MNLNNLVMDLNGTPTPVPFSIAGSEPSRARKVGISRREVLRRAELAVNRMPEPPRAIAPSRPRAPEVLGSNAESTLGGKLEVPASQEEKKDESSAPGSLHDSADDESDLSDLQEMEDVDPSSIFPNLMKKDEGTA